MRQRQIQLPSLLEGMHRVCSLKILEITINSHFSVSEHVSCVIGKCAQTNVHTLRILRSHGLCNDALHLVYRPLLLANSFMQWTRGGVSPQQLTVSVWKRSSNEAFDLASAQQTHLTWQNWLNPVTTHFLIVFYVTKITSYSLFFLTKEILPIISRKETTTDF